MLHLLKIIEGAVFIFIKIGLNPILKIFIGILVLFLASAVTLGVLITDLTEKSFYEETGNVSIEGISAKVTIAKDNFGVSHITASNEDDMYFALGYMHAQDRLWQMDIARRVGEGRLSEIMGPNVLEYDKLFRTIGINKTAAMLWEKVSPKTRTMLTKYAEGVNKFIENNSSSLPLEFDVLNYKPEPWKPEHSLIIVRLMGWELNIGWFTEYTLGAIEGKFGLERAIEFFPDYPEDAPYIVKGDSTTKKEAPKDSLKKPVSYHDTKNNYNFVNKEASDFFNTAMKFREFYGTEGSHTGSNAWVVNGSKTESGKPLLANDPHLALQVPSKWYEVDLYNDNSKRSICGFSIPGAPAVVIGSNTAISWGITNLMNDDTDLIFLDIDPNDRTKYRFNDSSYQIDSTVEAISVKGQKDEVSYTTYRTVLGPVISGLEKTGFRSRQQFARDPARLLTFRWTGFDVSDEVNAFYKINNAGNWQEFRDGLKEMGAPATSFVYADTMGNIGYHAAGKIPIREGMRNDYAPNYPSGGEIKWTGYIGFDEMPKAYNPKEGYIVTANNKPVKDYKYYISNLYEPSYRSQRIEWFLKGRGSFTADEFKLIQTDVLSTQAIEFCNYIFEAFRDSNSIKEEHKRYLKLLSSWDFKMLASSPAATLFAQFELELYRNLYKNVLGDELFNNYIYIKNIPVRNTSKLLKENSSWLMRQAAGQDTGRSARSEVIKKSFYDAINTLTERSGPDPNNWLWGEYHKVLMMHPLGIVPALSSILNIGPYDIGGSGTTIANSEYSFVKAYETGNFESFLGPSMRIITDMSNPRNVWSINSTGQSGQPIHPNYRDQARRWLNGEYKLVTTDLKKLAAEQLKVLNLEPKN